MQNKVKIIGGEWRSRVIQFADLPELRPTPARVRETLFNWLQHDIIARNCLDLFSGSGALSFEAASRGAKKVTQVEKNPAACKQLRENAALLKATQIQLIAQDALQFLDNTGEAYDIVFLDPPFASNLVTPICHLLENNQWLTPHALCYIETPAQFDFKDLPSNWQHVKHKVAGGVGYHLFSRNGS